VQCSSPGGLHRIAYKEWGDPANTRVLVCVHGVTRVADDFDALARDLCDTYRVICPDVAGRGRSQRLPAAHLYGLPQYLADMVTLIARVTAGGDGQVAWFGTSMGGLIGMLLAALPDTPITRLVLNDIGPTLDGAALARIADYIGQDLRFPDYESASRFVREVSLSFGPHTEAEWDKLARDVLRQEPDGAWVRHYDLALAQPFKAMTPQQVQKDEAALWRAWDAIACPTLLVRGALSDLLSRATAEAMSMRGPRPELVEIAGVGHAPTFVNAQQIAIARTFLVGPRP
jgi:pimeloyl-ACP methyl ester carboxylesterase